MPLATTYYEYLDMINNVSMMNYFKLLVWSLSVINYCVAELPAADYLQDAYYQINDEGLPAELCGDNSDICELITGCYADRDAKSRRCNIPWWAYVPKGCPEEGCPLYIWMGGKLYIMIVIISCQSFETYF